MSSPLGEGESTLLLSPEAPYPLAGGGPMRTASVLHFLAQRSPVHLITFSHPGAPAPGEALPAGLCTDVSTIPLPAHSRNMAAKVWRNGVRLLRGRLPLMDRFAQPASLEQARIATRTKHYSLAVIEHFWCADYLEALRPRARRVVLNLHNVESELHAGCARTEPWPQNMAHRYFQVRAVELEKRYLPQFDLVLVASDADAQHVLRIAPDARVAVYPNALPLVPAPSGIGDSGREVIAFSGNLGYHPNVRAVRFFCAQIWPELRRRRPNLTWRLIGKNEHAVRSIVGSDPRIELTGAIEDPVRELAQCRLAVVPLLAGSGTRVKIMEAWAACRAVVSSPIGAEGLPVEDGVNIALAHNPGEWIETVIDLLVDNESRARLGAAGRSTYEREFSWPAAWKRLAETLTSIDQRAGSSSGGLVTAE